MPVPATAGRAALGARPARLPEHGVAVSTRPPNPLESVRQLTESVDDSRRNASSWNSTAGAAQGCHRPRSRPTGPRDGRRVVARTGDRRADLAFADGLCSLVVPTDAPGRVRCVNG